MDEESENIHIGSISEGTGPVLFHATSNVVYSGGWILYYKQNSLLAQKFDDGSLKLTGEPIPVVENLLHEPVRSKGAFSVSMNGRLLFLATSRTNQEMAVFSTQGQIQNVIKSKVATTWAVFSNDNRYIATDAYDELSKNTDMWIHDIQRNNDTRLTFDKAVDIVPVWSSDDSKIYFSSNRSGRFCIYVKNSNGTGDEQLVYSSQQQSYTTDITRDGKYLILSINTNGLQKWNLELLELASKKTIPLLTSEFNEWLGTFSPDGKWYAYQSNETGKYEIYIRPTDGSSSKWQVSVNGGEQPKWINSGKEVMYSIGDQQLFSVPVSISGGQLTVGQSRLLFKVEPGSQSTFRDIARDGKRVIITRTLNTQTLKSASVIFNWQNLVEKK